MKKLLTLALGCLILYGTKQISSAASVAVDPAKPWLGYMNVFELPSNGGGYLWGSAWGTADLPASFSGGVLTIGPNVNCYNAADPYWVKPDGSGNKQMDASFYVEDNSLAGMSVNFTGNVLLNTLGAGYSSVAFIKEFNASYALLQSQTANLVGGSSFNLTLTSTPGNHVQYGFETIGAVANPASPLGSVQVAVVPEPATGALLLIGLAGFALRRKS